MDHRDACPQCREVGRPVADATIRAMLGPELGRELLASERRFCKTPGCDVVYYAAAGRLVRKQEVRVRVGLKETEDPIPLCYCFGFGRADVEREIAQTGGCTIPERIAAEIGAGRCACPIKNPSGACCLGEVRAAVDAARRRVGSPQRPK
jgi:CopZ-like zinc binding protein